LLLYNFMGAPLQEKGKAGRQKLRFHRGGVNEKRVAARARGSQIAGMFFPLRDDTPRVRPPVATVALIALNALVFLYQLSLAPVDQLLFARAAGAVPWEISHLRDLVGPGQPIDLVPPPLTLYTSLFLHGDLLHLLGNMWFLWLFGNKLEGFMGHLRFALFYFVAGTAAGLL
jgi:membrane associated rhomboid family serine protease